MKHIFFIAVLLTTLFCSCNSSSSNEADKNTSKDSVTAASANIGPLNLLGSFVGPFGDNKITLLITRIAGDTIEGRSVVGGNDRPYAGIIKLVNNIYTVTAKEPGDDKYDGVFNFTIDPKQPDVVTGNWKPNVEGSHAGPKDFSLKRRVFVYLKDAGDYPQGSQRLLAEDDVNNITKGQLWIMRNEIFARHGYCFKRKDTRDYFEEKDWYIPNTVDVRKDLTEIEKKNIAMIQRYEKYAQENDDDYGR